MTALIQPAYHGPETPPLSAPVSATQRRAGALRVLMVTPRYLPMTGGVENHVYEVARRLAALGVDITVLTTDPSGQLPTSERVAGVQVQRVRAWPAERDYYFAPDIYPIVMHGGWDLVHLQSYHTLVAPITMLAALRAGLPYVVTFHGGGSSSRVRNTARSTQRALLRPLLARATRLVAIARFEIAQYGAELGVPAERFAFIPNGADLPQVPADLPRRSGGPLIASVGRLERYKGHQRIIAAMPYILEQQPDARLWIAGGGPYEPELRRMIAELGLQERVEIRPIPMSERGRMAAELSQAAVVTLLSDFETHPIAALEALALGCPVLATNTSGLRELAEQGLVRAVELDSSPRQVAQGVLQQMSDPLRPADLVLPTWDACAEDLLALYQMTTQRLPCVS